MSDSRAVLLEAAAAEFAKHGPEGTRIQAIVRAAGVNERMIYHHFGSKDGLYTAVMQDQRYRLGAAWRPVIEQAMAMDPYPGMRTVLDGLFDSLLARPQVAALLMHESLGGSQPNLPSGTEFVLAPIRALYERGQAAGIFPADIPFDVAYPVAVGTLFAMAIFGPTFAGSWPEGLDKDPVRLRDQVVGQVLNGMTGPRTDD